MMSPQYLSTLRREAARKARRVSRQPLVVAVATAESIRSMPNFGDYRPTGWYLDAARLVDSSGMGAPGELATGMDGLLALIAERPGQGVAIIEEGQLQVVVGWFKQGRRPRGHRVENLGGCYEDSLNRRR